MILVARIKAKYRAAATTIAPANRIAAVIAGGQPCSAIAIESAAREIGLPASAADALVVGALTAAAKCDCRGYLISVERSYFLNIPATASR